jgi:hypothetical protein
VVGVVERIGSVIAAVAREASTGKATNGGKSKGKEAAA